MKTNIIGKSKIIQDVIKMIEQVAASQSSILVIGESGTGKELVARKLHELSLVSERPFVSVNCGAIPENLIESELFGHQKGSFTGAVVDKAGLFEVANGGSFFLDEIGELPLHMQVKLLRVLQDKTFRRVGGTKDIKVDVRIIAATNRNLEEEIAAGRFREDLYYRLNVILIRTPPLRERTEDIPLLSDFFLKKIYEKQKKPIKKFSKKAFDILVNYPWPGNVRELENTIERVATLETEEEIQVESFPAHIRGEKEEAPESSDPKTKVQVSENISQVSAKSGERFIQVPAPDFDSKKNVSLDQILGEIEKEYLKAALEHACGVKKNAAELLGVTFRSFRYRLQKHEME